MSRRARFAARVVVSLVLAASGADADAGSTRSSLHAEAARARRSGDLARELSLLERIVLDVDPGDRRARTRRAEILILIDRAEALRARRAEIDALLAEGARHLERDDLQAALEAFRGVQAVEPENRRADEEIERIATLLVSRGDEARDEGRWEAARRSYDEAAGAGASDVPRLLADLERERSAAERIARAKVAAAREAEAAARAAEEEAAALRRRDLAERGIAALAAGRLAEAEDLLARAEVGDPGERTVATLRAQVGEARQVQLALRDRVQAVRIALAEGDLRRARTAYDGVVDLDPDAEALDELARDLVALAVDVDWDVPCGDVPFTPDGFERRLDIVADLAGASEPIGRARAARRDADRRCAELQPTVVF